MELAFSKKVYRLSKEHQSYNIDCIIVIRMDRGVRGM